MGLDRIQGQALQPEPLKFIYVFSYRFSELIQRRLLAFRQRLTLHS